MLKRKLLNQMLWMDIDDIKSRILEEALAAAELLIRNKAAEEAKG